MQAIQPDLLDDDDSFEVDAPVERVLTGSWRRTAFCAYFVLLMFSLLMLLVLTGNRKVTRFTNLILGDFNVWSSKDNPTPLPLIAVCIFYMVVFYFLHRFSVKIKQAIVQDDGLALEEGAEALRLHFLLNTIISLIIILLCLVQLLLLVKRLLHY